MPGPDRAPLPPPSPDAVPNTNVQTPVEIQRAQLPDLSELPNMDEISASAAKQRAAEDEILGTGPSNARAPRISEFPKVDGHPVDPSEVGIVEAQVATADTTQNSTGLTAANNPRTTVRLGDPGSYGLPIIPKPEVVAETDQDQTGLIGSTDNPVPKTE